MSKPRPSAAALAALTLAGCASFSNVQTADTLGRGNLQAGIEPGLWGGAGTTGAAFLPHGDASVRYGVAERVDIGVRGGSSFLELQSKFLLTPPGDPTIAISIAPTIGGLVMFTVGSGSSNAGGGILNIGVPVLIGFKTSGGSEFIIGPRVQNMFFFGSAGSGSTSSSSSGYLLGLGGSLGFFWRIVGNFGLLPEVSAVYPVVRTVSSFGGGVQSLGASNGAFLQFKLGVIIGGGRKPGRSNPDLRQAPPPPPPPMPSADMPPPPPPPLPL